MNERDEVQPLLEELGSDDGPTVDGAFANRLEADLRTMHEARVAGPQRRPVWVPALGIVATVLAGAIAWTAVRGGDGSAVDVVPATTPSSESAPTTVEIDPSTTVEVAATGSTAATLTTTADAAPPSPSTTTPTDSTATTATTPTTTVASTTDTRASTTSASTPTTTTTRPSSTTTTVDRQAIDLTITATGADRLRFDWVPTDAVDAHSWRIDAIVGDRIATVAEIADPSSRSTTIARGQSAGVGYRIVALDRAGEVIVESTTVDQPAGR